jgi:pyruvate/2-oxoglutarate dehydrogenase complex dihydrolipoamide acyltransferase (E2) component
MTVKDLSRWQEAPDGSWIRRLGTYAEAGVNATQSAVNAAQELGIDLLYVVGTGKDGRITKADVEWYAGA